MSRQGGSALRVPRETQARVLHGWPNGLCGSSEPKTVFSYCVCVHPCVLACVCPYVHISREEGSHSGIWWKHLKT